MVETNRLINPITGRQWDVQSLIEKLLEMQDSLLQAQERNITLTAQARELERMARDHEDMKTDMENQAALLADKSRENKHLHQELSRMSSVLSAKLLETEELKNEITDQVHQLKTCQSERDLLAIMLTEAETAARQGSPAAVRDSKNESNWIKYLKGKQQ
jgi:chromosome segregation ATPase